MEALLKVENLRTVFGSLVAVDGVSFEVRKGETLGLVGESGSGKSVTAFSIIRLVQEPGTITAGRILFQGRDLLSLPEREMRQVRGAGIGFVFQEPMAALNPVMRVGAHIAEALLVHGLASRADAKARAIDLLRAVKIVDPEKRVDDYPHQLSGGMRQRVMIAMALACNPKLLIADEPTTALDVTIQAQILDLMRDLKRRVGAAIVLITHDLGVVADVADRVVVMYAGRKVEDAAAAELFADPRHPYTIGLLQAVPRVAGGGRLQEIPGIVPSRTEPATQCVFEPRCPRATDVCRAKVPPLENRSACFHPGRARAA